MDGNPIWSHDGHVCTGDVKQAVKLPCAGAASTRRGSSFQPEGNVCVRSTFAKGEKINQTAFKQLIRAAYANSVCSRGREKTLRRRRH